VLAFAVSMAALVVLPLPWLPAWPLAWLEAMDRYTGYTIYEAPLAVLINSPLLAGFVALLLLAWALGRWWVARHDTRARDWALSVLLVASALLAPRTSHVNQFVLLAPLFLVFSRLGRPGLIAAVELVLLAGLWALDQFLAPSGLEHMVWQHRFIGPILPVGLFLALLWFGPLAQGSAHAQLKTIRS
jgi:hypothetical protein